MLLKHGGVQKLLATAQDWADALFYGKKSFIKSEGSWYFENKLLHYEDKYWLLFILDIQDKVLSSLYHSKHWMFFDCGVKAYDADNILFANYYLQTFFFLSLFFVFKCRTSKDKPFLPSSAFFSHSQICHTLFLFILTTQKYRKSNGLDSYYLACGSKLTQS